MAIKTMPAMIMRTRAASFATVNNPWTLAATLTLIALIMVRVTTKDVNLQSGAAQADLNYDKFHIFALKL